MKWSFEGWPQSTALYGPAARLENALTRVFAGAVLVLAKNVRMDGWILIACGALCGAQAGRSAGHRLTAGVNSIMSLLLADTPAIEAL